MPGSVATISRMICSACSSFSARWSATPETRACSSPPPSSSGVTISPMAAFTSGGPPRKIVPWSAHDHRLIAHRRARRRRRRCSCRARRRAAGCRADDMRGLVEEDAAEVLAVGEHLVLQRQERAAGVDERDHRQAVLEGDLLRAEVLLHRHRVVGAALDGGVVADDHHVAALDEADARDEPGAGGVAVVQVVRGQRCDLEERAAVVEQALDALAREQLATGDVALAGCLGSAERGARECGRAVPRRARAARWRWRRAAESSARTVLSMTLMSPRS